MTTLKKFFLGVTLACSSPILFAVNTTASKVVTPILPPIDSTAEAYTIPDRLKLLVDNGRIKILDHFHVGKGIVAFHIKSKAGVEDIVFGNGPYLIPGKIVSPVGLDIQKQQRENRIYSKYLEDVDPSQYVKHGTSKKEIYVISDPNCGYCAQLFEWSKPLVESGKVTFKWIKVGYPGRSEKLSALALEQGVKGLQENFERKPIPNNVEPSARSMEMVSLNNKLKDRLGVRGTPALFYRTNSGWESLSGSPRSPKMLEQIVNSISE